MPRPPGGLPAGRPGSRGVAGPGRGRRSSAPRERRDALIAYVFWHRPEAGADRPAYERRLAGFHAALAASPPPGLARSATFRVEGAPWLESGEGYEDWYLVEDWPALGRLEEGAVAGARREPHDAVARLAGDGAAGLYAPVRAADDPLSGGAALWLGKPRGTAYPEFHARLEALVPGSSAIWQRKMVLGPAPEFCVTGEREAVEAAAAVLASPVAIVRRVTVWP